MLDALARMPDCDGWDSDAVGAYTQVVLDELAEKGKLGDASPTETWITLPKERWPAHWHGKYSWPVVRLRLNLYGHPLAGFYWEKHCTHAIIQVQASTQIHTLNAAECEHTGAR